ncbi:MAG: STAS domain-containing protein [Bacteroidales bacterium]|nr:STAS domain-containing protein [Bacteroidales bacterium]
MRELTLEYLNVKKQYRNYFVSFNQLDKINLLIVEGLKNRLFEIIRNPRSHVVLDLSNIRFIDSSGFAALDLLTRVSKIFGSSVTLIKVGSEVRELIELTIKYNGYSLNYFEKGYSKPWQMAG